MNHFLPPSERRSGIPGASQFPQREKYHGRNLFCIGRGLFFMSESMAALTDYRLLPGRTFSRHLKKWTPGSETVFQAGSYAGKKGAGPCRYARPYMKIALNMIARRTIHKRTDQSIIIVSPYIMTCHLRCRIIHKACRGGVMIFQTEVRYELFGEEAGAGESSPFFLILPGWVCKADRESEDSGSTGSPVPAGSGLAFCHETEQRLFHFGVGPRTNRERCR